MFRRQPRQTPPPQVLVIGDEVESVITAVSAARCGARVCLLKPFAQGWIGGLSTRGGLSYMDITWDLVPPLFAEFLKRAQVKRVALEPRRADRVLRQMLRQAGVRVETGIVQHAHCNESGRLNGLTLTDGRTLQAQIYLDTTPDGDIARLAGVPYIRGLGGLFGKNNDLLGISPVFRITGVDPWALAAFETRLRQHPDCATLLREAMPHHPTDWIDSYVTRNPICPRREDYLDILNPALGVFYHLCRHQNASSYSAAPVWIDGGNISRLSDRALGFNGMVSRAKDWNHALALSHGAEIPPQLREEMTLFEEFLKTEGAFPKARVIPPQAIYVRQTLNLQARLNQSGANLLSGGVDEADAIGTFSYWFDFRGINLFEKAPDDYPLPKPVFNVGLHCAFPKNPALDNLAFVSRSGGYSPVAQGACRIVQHQALLGEAIGIASALACLEDSPLQNIPAARIRSILQQRSKTPLSPPSGKATWTTERIQQSKLLQQDIAIIEALQSLTEGVLENASC
ncbi:MAG: FAD-dependent oxidoreductase [Candidatus Melainabacteria bacterium]|nr:FAD-dependent oxidoreductase [Candidatus Melainabacteria bacterium]